MSKHINREAKGNKRCGRKKCTSKRIVKQNPFKNVGEIHKEWTAAGVSASRTTTHRRMQDMGFSCRIPCVKPLLNNRHLHLHLHFYAFSRRFYPKRLTIAFRLYIFISICVPWESNPQPFALLTQCSTTEPHRNTSASEASRLG